MFDLIDGPTYRHSDVSVSTDYRTLKSGATRSNGKFAVYAHGKRLHGDIGSYGEALMVRDLYVNGEPATDPRWQWYGGKQPSPLSDDMRRARADIIMDESGCDSVTAFERANFEYAHNLLDPHTIVRDSGVTR